MAGTRRLMHKLLVTLALAGCAAPAPGARHLQASAQAVAPTGLAPAPTSQAAAEAAVRKFFAATFADDKAISYSFAPYVRSAISRQGIAESGIFICGTLTPQRSSDELSGPQIIFAHFNPLKTDVVDNASVQPGKDTVTAALCRQAYGRAGVALPPH